MKTTAHQICSVGDGTVTLFLLLTHLYCMRSKPPPPPSWFRECSTTGPSLQERYRVDTHFIDSVAFVLYPHCDHLCTQAGVTGGSHKELESFFGVFWCRSVFCIPALFLLWPLQRWDTYLLSRGFKKKDQNTMSLCGLHSGLIHHNKKR